MKKYFFLLLSGALVFAAPVIAQEATDVIVSAEAQVQTDAEVMTEGDNISETVNISTETSATGTLDGITVNVPKEIPSGFGFFLRGFRERVSLLTTFNPVKKAEKQLQFAEERMQIAKTIAEKSSDPKVQAKAEQMVAKASEYIQKITDKNDAWLDKKDERSKKLLKNIATHEQHREDVMSRLEEKLPEEQAEKIREERHKQLEQSKRLLNAISNVNIPEDVRKKLEENKARIDTHVAEQKAFEEKTSELLDRLANGDENAQAELEALKQERMEALKARVEDAKVLFNTVKEKKDELREKAKTGDQKAAQELRMINKVQERVREAREEVREIKKETKEEGTNSTVDSQRLVPSPELGEERNFHKVEQLIKQEIMRKEEDGELKRKIEEVRRSLEEEGGR